MSKEAIKKLNDAHKSYDLTVETTLINEIITVDSIERTTQKPAAKVVITIFEHGEKGAIVTKKSAAYGTGKSFEAAQDAGITKAVEGLGL